MSTKDAKGRESAGRKWISTGLRSSDGPVRGFCQGQSPPLPVSFALFVCFVDPHRMVPAKGMPQMGNRSKVSKVRTAAFTGVPGKGRYAITSTARR